MLIYKRKYTLFRRFNFHGLHIGRIISMSKSGYRKHFPNNVAVFNANVISKSYGKIWFGDLDITIDDSALKKIAEEIGEPLYVLREMDARFENENKSIKELILKAIWNTTK